MGVIFFSSQYNNMTFVTCVTNDFTDLTVTPRKQNLLDQFFVSHLKSTVITLLKGMPIFLGGFELEPKHRYVMKIPSFHYCVSLFVPNYS